MSKIFALITLTLVVCVSANTIPEEFVIGGGAVAPFTNPFTVSLQRYDGQQWVHFCGGALIRENWVLTAPQCAGTNIMILTGKYNLAGYETGEQRRGVAKVEYSADLRVALLRLDSNIVFDSRTENLTLPANPPRPAQPVFIAGWSTKGTNSQVLGRANFEVMSSSACEKIAPRSIDSRFELCTTNFDASKNGRIGTCDGNLGSPVVQERCRYVLIGIVTGVQSPCLNPSQPTAIVASLAPYYNWIVSTAGDGRLCRSL